MYRSRRATGYPHVSAVGRPGQTNPRGTDANTLQLAARRESGPHHDIDRRAQHPPVGTGGAGHERAAARHSCVRPGSDPFERGKRTAGCPTG
ncbi:hypothetical protein FRAHR75_790024 [Frankia sp. Hr75.2]|nr:hypothetical protein FRAHR75_790024 [Frankia sp. Hr75.2]